MFERALRVPAGLEVDDVKATYKDGILEVRVPLGATDTASRKTVPVIRAS